MNGKTKARGFTLVELLVTMALIVILASVGIPMYGQFTQQSGLTGANSELIATINETRSRAVSERRSIRLERVNAGAVAGDWSGGWQMVRVADGERLQTVDRGGRAGTVTVIEAGANNLMTFSKEGRTTAAFQFDVCDLSTAGEIGRMVAITVMGRISATRPACP